MAGSSDGGAHLLSFTGADYPTRLLSEWVPDVLTLEEAVRKLTAVPAAVHGLADRGAVREGAWADLVVVDLSRLRAGATRLVHDFPGGSGRFVWLPTLGASAAETWSAGPVRGARRAIGGRGIG